MDDENKTCLITLLINHRVLYVQKNLQVRTCEKKQKKKKKKKMREEEACRLLQTCAVHLSASASSQHTGLDHQQVLAS
jgi:hypothetical protein